MNKYIIICIMCFVCFPMMQAQNIQYTKSDSVKVESFMAEAYKQDFTTNWVLYFSSKLMGIPYVAKTLEGNDTEKLIIMRMIGYGGGYPSSGVSPLLMARLLRLSLKRCHKSEYEK